MDTSKTLIQDAVPHDNTTKPSDSCLKIRTGLKGGQFGAHRSPDTMTLPTESGTRAVGVSGHRAMDFADQP